jgi:hypothetical protein
MSTLAVVRMLRYARSSSPLAKVAHWHSLIKKRGHSRLFLVMRVEEQYAPLLNFDNVWITLTDCVF